MLSFLFSLLLKRAALSRKERKRAGHRSKHPRICTPILEPLESRVVPAVVFLSFTWHGSQNSDWTDWRNWSFESGRKGVRTVSGPFFIEKGPDTNGTCAT